MKYSAQQLKPACSLLFGFLAISSTACAAPKMKTTFHVVDAKTGLPITNAVVQKSFRVNEQKDRQEKVKVDENGYCTISGENISYSGGGAGAFADEYYSSNVDFKFEKRNHVLNRWEPWNPTVEVKLRPKKNPIPMVVKYIDREMIPAFEKPVGFDLEKGDWVAPYGKGTISDFIFTAHKKPEDRGVECNISFINKEDGIQEYVPENDTGSEYIFPYLAPTNNYVPTIYREEWYPDEARINRKTNAKPNEKINHIFRVRTVVDDDGNIMKACYGRVQGEIVISCNGRLYLKYWFNPVPNERSLEWNGVNLLKK